MRIYWINAFKQGNLGMMARPRGNDWLEDDIKKLKLHDVNGVVSLLEYSEIKILELEKEELFCNKYGINYINHPIPDRGIPEKSTYLKLISDIDDRLKANQKIIVHCRMGIGRTSMISAGVLLKNEMKPDTIFDFLSTVRTLEVPDTNAQKQWIEALAESTLF